MIAGDQDDCGEALESLPPQDGGVGGVDVPAGEFDALVLVGAETCSEKDRARCLW